MSGGMAFGGGASEPKDMTPWEFKYLRSPVAGGIKDIIQTQGGPQYEGPFAAQIGGAEAQALQNVQGFGTPNVLQGQSDAVLGQHLSGQNLSPESNPFLQQTIDAATRPIFQAFDDQELQERALFSRAGQKLQESSPFAQSRARSNEGLLNAVGDVSGRIAGDNFQRGLDRQQQAVNQQAATQQARFEQSRGVLEASALPRLIEQLGIEGGREEFNRRMQMIVEALRLGGELGSPTLGNDSFQWNMEGQGGVSGVGDP